MCGFGIHMEERPHRFDRLRERNPKDWEFYMYKCCTDPETGEKKPVELILPDDDDLVAQLSGRKYGLTDTSKIRVESKEAMKKRGQPSPDEADCVLLLCLPVKPPKKRGVRKNGDR